MDNSNDTENFKLKYLYFLYIRFVVYFFIVEYHQTSKLACSKDYKLY